MDNPIFKLEKVVQPRSGESLEDFEGPLDLILFLLSKNKIEIQDIPIALILDQYLAYLEQRQRMDLEVASEFVTMAAHLMYIKTRMLLSIEDEEAQSEMDELIRSLEERQRSECYLKIKQLTQKLGPMSEFGRSILTRTPEPMERGKVYEYSQDPADLVIALQEMLDRHLIEECGRLQVPGRPRLYRTTKAFLRAFHLNSLEDLPEMPGLETDGQLRIAEPDGAAQPEE